jgi:hypothetical protein
VPASQIKNIEVADAEKLETEHQPFPPPVPELACIAHKFLDRPATLRPPASLREALRARRSDKGGEFVSDADSGSGILRLRRTIPLLFGEKILKTVCFNELILNQALKLTRSVCLRAF